MMNMPYENWLAELAEILNLEPESLDEDFPQLRPLLYDGGLSPNEAADCLRSGM
jgi:hypothetical protein